MLDSDWHQKVLGYWFDELTPKQWYVSTKAIDDTIQQRFEPLITVLASTEPETLGRDAHKLLAGTIVLDQFPRNIYRGSSQAFAYDPTALKMAEYCVAMKLDQNLSATERQFSYMPFMHSENLEKQQTSVELFTQLGTRQGAESAIEHRDIVAQFGRFPHRNDVMKRQSTEQELAYLANAKRFGQ